MEYMQEVVLVNKMEDAVKNAVADMLEKQNGGLCKCARCRLDITALTLNSLEPKYVVTTIGNAMINVSLSSVQGQANITSAICSAIEIVKSRPRHG